MSKQIDDHQAGKDADLLDDLMDGLTVDPFIMGGPPVVLRVIPAPVRREGGDAA